MNTEFLKLTEKYSINVNGNLNDNDDFSIFNSQQFLNLHRNKFKNLYTFSLHEINTGKSHGVSIFNYEEEGLFISPIIGSYGGFEFHENVNFQTKESFIEKIIDYLIKKKAKAVEIILAPDIYNLTNNSQVLSILYRLGFKLNQIEINQFIENSKYDKNISVSYGNRKRINKCIKEGFIFKKLIEEEYYSAYDVIRENRSRKGFPLTMEWRELEEMVKVFQSKVHFFGIFHSSKIISSAICIDVLKNILYVFYWGEIGGYEKFSPTAFLSERIINYSKSKQYHLVDIGTSTVKSDPNHGLFKFKENIGCYSCNKFKLVKKI